MSPIEPSNLSFQEKKKPKNVGNKIKKIDEIPLKQELDLRPSSLDEYIGQPRLKEILKITVNAAIIRGDLSSIGHTLLYGPPGLGKTSFAILLSKMIGSKIHIISAPALDKPKDIVGILMSLGQGDILFLDEIHRLNRITEELLYPALEDFSLDISSGKGSSTRVTRLPLPRFILVGATTKLGSISSPLRDRFLQIHRMESYSQDELAQIARLAAKKLHFELPEEAANEISKSCRGVPRIAIRLCKVVRDFATHEGVTFIDAETARRAMNLMQIDEHGLDNIDRIILKTIMTSFGGGPVGLESLAAATGEDRATLEDYYEPYLIQKGFLERTSKGRKITKKASEIYGEKELI